MENIFEIAKHLDIIQIISIFVCCWLATLPIRREIKLMNKRLDVIDKRLTILEDKVGSIDLRLGRLEGRFEERGYWESRNNKTQL